jgi:hypothetical protein
MSEETKEADVIPIGSAKKEEEPPPPGTTTTAEMGLGEQARLKWWEAAFWKLTKFPRFMTFITDNYVFGYNKDGNPLDPIVNEKDLKIPLSADQIFKIGAACMQHGAKDATALTKRILGILGHKESAILPASEADVKRIVQSQDIDKRLDP